MFAVGPNKTGTSSLFAIFRDLLGYGNTACHDVCCSTAVQSNCQFKRPLHGGVRTPKQRRDTCDKRDHCDSSGHGWFDHLNGSFLHKEVQVIR